MVQPYVEAVDREGETALLYVGGELSHAVRKAALLTESGKPGEGLYVEERITATQPSRRRAGARRQRAGGGAVRP